jgi:hypothetical protein
MPFNDVIGYLVSYNTIPRLEYLSPYEGEECSTLAMSRRCRFVSIGETDHYTPLSYFSPSIVMVNKVTAAGALI